MKRVSDNMAGQRTLQRTFTLSPHQPIRFQNVLTINIRTW